MKWMLLAFQLFSTHKTMVQSRAFMEKAKGAAEASKKMAFFSMACLIASVYFITGTIVGIISLGTQLDSGNGVTWNGMLWSATALVFVAVFIVGIGLLVMKFPGDDEEEEKRKKAVTPVASAQDLKVAVEQLAVTFLTQLAKNLLEPKKPQEGVSPEKGQ